MSSGPRPAFYALRAGGWRDYANLLHPPYTLWHLSYVVIGATFVTQPDWTVLGLTLLAFALALGIGAHALDELRGHPLATEIPDAILVTLAAASIAMATGIGVAVAVARTWWLLVFVAAGAFVVVAYNLELFGGRFHTDLWFGLSWGGFPLLVGSFAIAERVRADALIAACFATLLSIAQRELSHQARDVRRRVSWVDGAIAYEDGRSVPLDADALARAPERALRALAGSVIALAIALVVHSLA